MKRIEQIEFKKKLMEFTGSEHYFKHWTGRLVYTDGIKYLADRAKAYWLIDLIASYQHLLKEQKFQIWTLKVNYDKTVVVVCREDIDMPIIVKQKIEHTDFPLGEFECYFIAGVLLLKTEY